MKKVIAIILLIIYTMSAYGISAKYHYCMNKLTNTRIGLGSGHDCKCTVPIPSHGCCKDKVFYLISDNHNINPIGQVESNDSWMVLSDFLKLDPMPEGKVVFAELIITDPYKSPPSIFLLNQNFRI